MDDLRKAYQTSVIIHNAIVASLFIYIILAELIRRQLAPFEGLVSDFDVPLLRYVLFAWAVFQFILIRKIRGVLLKKASLENREDIIIKLSRASIITSALAEVPAIFGFILFILGGLRNDFYVLLALSSVYLIVFFPKFQNWEKWARKDWQDADRRML